MYTKTYEKVLRKLLEIYKEKGVYFSYQHEELENVFGMPKEDIKSSLAALCDLNLVFTDESFDNINISINDRAFGYFKAKEEHKKNEFKNKWTERIISFLSGVIATIVTLFLTKWIR